MSGDDIRPDVKRDVRLDLHRQEDAEADADSELEALFEEEVRHHMARGATLEDARAAAQSRLGVEPARTRKQARTSAGRRERSIRWRDWISDAASDLRYGARAWLKSPAVAGAALLTLALAIGANTAIFSAVNAVLLRPLPFHEPGRLVALWEENPNFGWYQQDAAPANMLDWKEQAAEVFTDVAGYQSFGGGATLTGRGDPAILSQQAVTGNFFSVLGIQPSLGRLFRDEETWQGGLPAVVLSHRAWRDRFGADPGIVGQSLQLDGRPAEVVGVLPAGFAVPGLDPDLWRTVGWNPENRTQTFFRRAHFVRVIARLEPGVTHERADAALQVVVKRLQNDYPATNTRMGAGLTPLHEFMVGRTRLPLLVMLGAVAVLLLIACANVANLLLVRAAGRERETALRLALGAGRGRLFRQSLTESALLAGVGSTLGLALGWVGARVLAGLQPAGLLPVEVRMTPGVVGYVSLVTVAAALTFGVAPMLARGHTPGQALRDDGRGGTGPARGRLGHGLLVGQIALVLTLGLGAGLLIRSYLQLLAVDPGFDTSNVLAVGLEPRGERYDTTDELLAFFDAVRRNTAALPGVTAVAVVSRVPLGPPTWTSEFAIAGRPPIPAGTEIVHREVIGPYHEVMRVPLLAGRMLSDTDRGDSPLAVVVNQTFAQAHFPGESPIGHRITFDREPDSTSPWRAIVGVIGDERQRTLAEPPRPEVFAPMGQEPRSAMTLVVRTTGAPLALAPPLRGILSRLDPDFAWSRVQTMDDVRARSLGRDRFLTILLGLFAAVGLMLGLVGVYGVVAQLARRRRREMGIRLALGAESGQVRWMMVRHGVVLAGLGVGLGLAGALAVIGVIRSLLFQVAPVDPVTFALVPALVLLTAALASWIPAVRAARTDPSEVLRSD